MEEVFEEIVKYIMLRLILGSIALSILVFRSKYRIYLVKSRIADRRQSNDKVNTK